MATVAHSRHWEAASLDYVDTTDPAVRLERLLRACAGVRVPRLLVISSRGGWVAAEAALLVGTRGVFLQAPVLCMPDYPSQEPQVPVGRTEPSVIPALAPIIRLWILRILVPLAAIAS